MTQDEFIITDGPLNNVKYIDKMSAIKIERLREDPEETAWSGHCHRLPSLPERGRRGDKAAKAA